MKKYIVGLLAMVLVFSATYVFAQERIKVFINGAQLKLSTDPLVEKGTTLVPMRSIFEALGVPLNWDKATQTVSGNKDGKEIKLTIGKSVAYVNEKPVSLSVPAKIINSNTLVPLRFVAEALGSTVEWRSSISSVLISTDNYVYSQNFVVPESSDLYAIDGTGQYASYKQLKGYPEEDHYLIYFQGNQNSFHVKSVDIRNINLNEKVKWTYNGKSYTSTKKELHSFFVDTAKLKNYLGATNYTFTDQWYRDTFGEVYTEWVAGFAIENDAARWVTQYFDQLNGNIGGTVINDSFDYNYVREEQETIFAKEPTYTSKYANNDYWVSEYDLEFWDVGAILLDNTIEFYDLSNNDFEVIYVLEKIPLFLGTDTERESNGVKYVEDVYGDLYFYISDLSKVGILPELQ